MKEKDRQVIAFIISPDVMQEVIKIVSQQPVGQTAALWDKLTHSPTMQEGDEIVPLDEDKKLKSVPGGKKPT